jgi:hypothetical protein
LKKILKYSLTIIVTLVVALASYLKFGLPNVGQAPKLKVEATAERIERGKYLANYVCVCVDCHSTRDWGVFSGPIVEGTLGKGGEKFGEEVGFPGTYYSRNITPSGLKDWTDGEIFRAITCGVSKDGSALFPVMPYPYYGKMDVEDINCIIAYIRTLQPIENTPAVSKSNFPMNFIVNTIPKKGEPKNMPLETNVENYGNYLASAAACIECHTPVDKGQIIASKAYSGGREFAFPNGNIIRSSNITQDEKTGIGSWTEKQFVQLFKIRSDSAALHQKVGPNDFNTIMPWTMYGKMKPEDLKAIFAYLKTVKGIRNQVERFTKKS